MLPLRPKFAPPLRHPRSAIRNRRSALRRGLTLMEILLAILVMGIGLVSLASLFPIGLEAVSRAEKDSRAAVLAMAARSEIIARQYIERLLGTNPPGNRLGTSDGSLTNVNCFQSPGGGLTPIASGRSYALVIDPVGGTYWATVDKDKRYVGPGIPDPVWMLGEMPRFPLFRQSGPTTFSSNVMTESVDLNSCYDALFNIPIDLSDKLQTQRRGMAIAGSPDDPVWSQVALTDAERATPAVRKDSGGAVMRDSTGYFADLQRDWRYSWMAIVQMRDVANPTVFELRIAVFRNRSLTLEAERFLWCSALVATPGTTTLDIYWPQQPPSPDNTPNLTDNEAPEIRLGSYVLDGQRQHGCFYRIVDVGPVTSASADGIAYFKRTLTLESPLRSDLPSPTAVYPIILPGLVEVFESIVTVN